MKHGRAAIAASIATVALAIDPHAQARQAPTFRTGVEAVSLDVSVLDQHRHPVTGLTADDFTILEDSHARPVIAFAAVDALASNRRLKQFPSSLPLGKVDPEAASPGRVVGIIMPFAIVNDNTGVASQIAREIVNELEPDDLAMVIIPGQGGKWTATSDKATLLKQIERPVYSLGQDEEMNRGRDVCGTARMDAMTAFAEAVRDVSTRRKVMFFINAMLPFRSQDECAAMLAEARERLFHAVRVANVTVYSMDPTGLTTGSTAAQDRGDARNPTPNRTAIMQGTQARQGSLMLLPDLTGGRAVVDTNTPQMFVRDIFAETASYYVLGFQAESPAKVGTHHISVRVARPDVHVVARTQWDAGR